MQVIFCLFIGIIFLIVGSKIMIEALKDIGAFYHYSKITIGVTIVAFGTSIPELLVSLKAMASGYSDIVLFNVIGSNIINILLVLGICSIIRPLKITSSVIKKELPLTILSTLLFLFLSLDDIYNLKSNNLITRLDAAVLIMFFILYLILTYRNIRKRKDVKHYDEAKYPLKYSVILSIIGFCMIFIGSIFTVDIAYKISEFNVSLKLLSISLIAFATSIPELSVCMHLIKSDNDDLVIGNILGSNIFNICIVLGIPIIIFGGLNANSMSFVDIVNLVVVNLILYIFAPIKSKLGKFEGNIMIILLIVYYSFILWEGLGL